jgi:ferredoxin
MAKEFAVTIDPTICFNCGVCMDVCPIRTLDMTRPDAPGPEATFFRNSAPTPPYPWMMAAPVQVSHCNGCTICVRECPVQAITIAASATEPVLAPRQGPILTEPKDVHGRWEPLSAYTRAAAKVQDPREPHDPWGVEPRWRLAKRAGPWQVWRTWVQNRSSR